MEFLIKKGNHYCSNWYFGLHFGTTTLKQKVRFNQSCLYTPDSENDWNKGSGFTYSLFNDNNSIRWAWRPSTIMIGMIEVILYIHKNGHIITASKPTTLEINKEHKIRIINRPNLGLIDLHIGNITFPDYDFQSIATTLIPKIGYINRPYFGGQAVAPHDIKINITNIK